MTSETESASEGNRPLKKKISITIDEDLVKLLQKLSFEQSRPLSHYINYVLRRHVESIYGDALLTASTSDMTADSKAPDESKSKS